MVKIEKMSVGGKIAGAIFGIVLLFSFFYAVALAPTPAPSLDNRLPEDLLRAHCDFLSVKNYDMPVSKISLDDFRESEICKATGRWK